MAKKELSREIVMTTDRPGYPKRGTKLTPSEIRSHRWVYEYEIADYTDPRRQEAADRALAQAAADPATSPVPPAMNPEGEPTPSIVGPNAPAADPAPPATD